MKISEQLKSARALIDTPSKWLQGQYGDGNASEFENSTCFCSLGAIHRAMGNGMYAPDKNTLSIALGKAMGGSWEDISEFNDGNEHETVMAAWDEAIRLAEAEESQ